MNKESKYIGELMKIVKMATGPLQVNSYMVWDEETNKGFIVDPGGYSPKIEQTIKENNIDLEYIILTHGHVDHIGGVEWVKAVTGAKIVGTEEEVEMFENSRINMSADFGESITFSPDVIVDDMDTMKIGNMELLFIKTPGHSKGGMCIKVDKALFSGDTLFHSSVGRTDFYGGSMPTLVKSIKEKLFTLDDDVKVFPGHMGTTTIGYEKEHNPFV